jgi:oligosaccharyltransferase complex subunit alpha (ribophorin I)
MTGSKIFIAAIIVLLVGTASSADLFDNIVAQDVTRDVNLQSQLAKIDTFVKFRNNRDRSVDSIYVAIPNEYTPYLSLLVVRDDDLELKVTRAVNPTVEKAHNATLYVVALAKPLEKGGLVELTITEIYWKRMMFLPQQIQIFEDQLVVFEDYTNFFTPYAAADQKSIFKIAGSIISYSDYDGNVRGKNIEYIYQTETDAFTRRPVRIHFENNNPFSVFKNVTKVIEISHWGNIAVEEWYELTNDGAKFTGEYSRVDFNNFRSDSGKNALKSLKAKLPYHTWGLHYRDEIGNVSTSKASRQGDNVIMEMQPRFPLLGGWKSNWVLSYNLPTKQYLNQEISDDKKFVLKQKFGFSVDKILCEDYTLKIIFPEGAKNLNLDLPFDVDGKSETKTYSYLDFWGRPTLIIRKKNVLDHHAQQFTASYTFESTNMLIEPFYLLAGLLALFAALIFVGRIDLAFEKKGKTN